MNPSFNKDDYLCHYGIKGQKKGIRRYQNLDGSLTPLGYEHYGYGKNKGKSKRNIDLEAIRKREAIASLVINAAMLNPFGVAVNAYDLVNAAKARKKEEQFDERVKNLKIDPKTGFHIKNKKMTEEEDMELVNPAYKNFNDNTKNNCVYCTSTYEMRRRGYDVTANKNAVGCKTEDVKKWFDTKINTENDLPSVIKKTDPKYDEYRKLTKRANRGDNVELARTIVSELKKQGNGARGNLLVTWGIRQGGHSVVYEIKNNSVIIRDCQSNKVLDEKDAYNMLMHSAGASFARLDNAKFNVNNIKEVCR